MALRKNLTAIFLCLFLPVQAHALDFTSWWLTADQQGDRLFRQQRFDEAASVYQDPMRKGVALYRAGKFEQSAGVFASIGGADALFNQGNAVLFLGEYEMAIHLYERALEIRPDWSEAMQNRDLALARWQLLNPPNDDAGGTGGELEADEIVFDESGRVNDGGNETETEGGEELSDSAMREVWLRRVDNRPADFLRARFAYQLYRQSQDEDANE